MLDSVILILLIILLLGELTLYFVIYIQYKYILQFIAESCKISGENQILIKKIIELSWEIDVDKYLKKGE